MTENEKFEVSSPVTLEMLSRDPGEDTKKVLARLKDLDREVWLVRVGNAFEKKRKISESAKRDFGERVLSEIASIVAIANLCIAENDDVKDVLSKIEKLAYYTEALKRSKEELGFLYIADLFSSQTLAKKSGEVNLEKISDYLELVRIYITMSHEKSRKAGPKNGKQMLVCHFICKAYEYYLGERPTFSDADYLSLADSPDAGTPYEHVCKLVDEIVELNISWSTMKKACETYKEDFAFMALTISSDDEKLMKSLQKFL